MELEKLSEYSERSLDDFILEIDIEYNKTGIRGSYHQVGAAVAVRWGVEYDIAIVDKRNSDA